MNEKRCPKCGHTFEGCTCTGFFRPLSRVAKALAVALTGAALVGSLAACNPGSGSSCSSMGDTAFSTSIRPKPVTRRTVTTHRTVTHHRTVVHHYYGSSHGHTSRRHTTVHHYHHYHDSGC